MTVLDASTVAGLGIPGPTYDRGAVRVGVVHFGVGGFHRAHQAMYLHRLMQQGQALEYGICGVGVLPGDARMRDVLSAQDFLYTLVEKGSDGSWRPEVIGSIVDYRYAPDDPDAVVELMADPGVRIVSLTITEGGYTFSPGAPAPVFELVTEALVRRRERGLEPFAVMSCDNIQGNGHVAQQVLTAYAATRDPGLGEWIRDRVAFPSSMVDRITPVTTDEDRAQLRERFGVEDGWPVVCEPFTQWALEDAFPVGRPPFEEAGVQVVPDVEPYELMKLRLLNASHQALCYFGYLAGYRLVHEVAQDPLFAEFLLAYMDVEATPTLAPVPGVDLDAYKHQLVERFSNAAVRDTVARLCAESSDRIPKWLLPVVRENLAAGREVSRSAAVVASWARYAEGVDEQGEPIRVVDRLADVLGERAREQRDDPLAFLRHRDLFGDLPEQPDFTEPYLAALAALHERGSRATLEALVRGAVPA